MFKSEWKNILKHRMTMLTVIAMLLVPGLYGLFFLSAYWNPYGHTDRLSVAVVNGDTGTEYEGKRLEVGKDFVDGLKDNDSFKWVVTDKQEALEGLNREKYIMVIELPNNFSENASTLLNKDPKKMNLKYYTNAGMGYSSAQIAKSAIKEVNDEIAEQVTKEYASTVFGSLTDLVNGLKDADDGAKKLNDGAADLAEGSQKLTDNLKKLAENSVTFQQGVGDLKNGAGTLSTGIVSAASGAAQLNDGLGTLSGGAKQLDDGLGTLSGGAKKLDDGLGALSGGAKKLDDGLGALSTGAGSLQSGAQQLDSGLTQLKDGADTLAGGSQKLEAGAEQLNQGLGQSNDGLQQLQEQLTPFTAGMDQLNQAVQGLGGQASSAVDQMSAAQQQLQQKAAAIKQQQEAMAAYIQGSSTIPDADKQKLLSMMAAGAAGTDGTSSGDGASASQLQQSLGQLDQLSSSVAQLNDGAKRIQTAVGQLAAGQSQLVQGSSDLLDGQKQLTDGLGTLSAKIGEAEAGSKQLADGAAGLVSGAGQLKDGSQSLVSGVGQLQDGSQSLVSGAGQLKDGSQSLVSGTARLQDGSQSLVSGLGQLKDGGSQLVGGLGKLGSATGELRDGADKLADGSVTLNDGVGDLKEGTNELYTSLNDGVQEAGDVSSDDKTYDMFAQPTELTHDDVHDVTEYGEGLAPYMMSIALFAGALMFSSVYPLKTPQIRPRSGLAWFLSKFSVILFMAVLQSAILDAVLIGIVGLQVQSLWHFYAITLTISLTFLSLLFFLFAALGKVGQFIAFLILLAQIGGSAGTFPKVLTPDFFQAINPYLPATYGIRALREAVSLGNDWGYFWGQLAHVGIFGVVFILLALLVFLFSSKMIKTGIEEEQDIEPATV
ncbi:YhgE/Pip domain-containing protein [Saccharibacillus alkalitolerans]|uniref:YhgE/Pip domain-containing protein n=1 Tax=Saccharibacillus alkalitolerans TaxID=2705290 RepID=A0ABX0FBH0_9BACL|nr:YhgE/Pip domain-containing protein [Saccharibacillus alkalitolerans]NGZ77304.1 YhgE/Pip domain-containing protein [Saccharibacillus alkalitolerans]